MREMRCGLRVVAGLIAGAWPCVQSSAASAQGPADFYKGRTLSLVVGYATGGGYDLYARLAARFLSRHVPGQPTVVVQNMTGAGGLRAAGYVQNAAPKDGSVITLHPQTLPFDTLLGLSEGVDAARFAWLGRIAMNVEVGVAFTRSGLRTPADLRAREVPVGGTGGTASSSLVPFLLNRLGGTRFKLIAGYQSAQEVMLAMQRGEVEAVGATGISTVMAVHGQALRDGSIVLLYQTAREHHPALTHVPTIAELGRSPQDAELLSLFASTAEVGRSLAVVVDAPRERIDALQAAVGAMLTDGEFLAAAQGQRLDVEPANAEQIGAIVRATLATSRTLADKARAVHDEAKR